MYLIVTEDGKLRGPYQSDTDAARELNHDSPNATLWVVDSTGCLNVTKHYQKREQAILVDWEVEQAQKLAEAERLLELNRPDRFDQQ